MPRPQGGRAGHSIGISGWVRLKAGMTSRLGVGVVVANQAPPTVSTNPTPPTASPPAMRPMPLIAHHPHPTHGVTPGLTRGLSRDRATAARWQGRARHEHLRMGAGQTRASQDGSRVKPGMTPSKWKSSAYPSVQASVLHLPCATCLWPHQPHPTPGVTPGLTRGLSRDRTAAARW